MTESNAKAPEGMHTITPHIVVNDAAKAAAWYKEVLGAEERSRIELPGGNLMQVELWFGDSAVMLADEFPELGVLSPLSVGGTSTVLHLYTKDVDALWKCAVDGGAEVRQPPPRRLLGRALREDHRSLRPPLGPCTAPAQRSAPGDCRRRSRDVWLAPLSRVCISKSARLT